MKKLFALFLTFTLCAMAIPSLYVQGQKSGNAASRSEASSVPGELLVQFRADATDNDKVRALGRVNGEALENIRTQAMRSDGRGDLVLARFQPDLPEAAAMRSLKDDPAVEFVEPNWIYTHQAVSNDPL